MRLGDQAVAIEGAAERHHRARGDHRLVEVEEGRLHDAKSRPSPLDGSWSRAYRAASASPAFPVVLRASPDCGRRARWGGSLASCVCGHPRAARVHRSSRLRPRSSLARDDPATRARRPRRATSPRCSAWRASPNRACATGCAPGRRPRPTRSTGWRSRSRRGCRSLPAGDARAWTASPEERGAALGGRARRRSAAGGVRCGPARPSRARRARRGRRRVGRRRARLLPRAAARGASRRAPVRVGRGAHRRARPVARRARRRRRARRPVLAIDRGAHVDRTRRSTPACSPPACPTGWRGPVRHALERARLASPGERGGMSGVAALARHVASAVARAHRSIPARLGRDELRRARLQRDVARGGAAAGVG